MPTIKSNALSVTVGAGGEPPQPPQQASVGILPLAAVGGLGIAAYLLSRKRRK